MKIINEIADLMMVLTVICAILFIAMTCFGVITDSLVIAAGIAGLFGGVAILVQLADILETYETQEIEG
jgi:hypothetical protein